MKSWTVVIPAWGDRAVSCFLNAGLPAIKAGLARLKDANRARFLIYTDQADRMDRHLGNFSRTYHGPPSVGGRHRMLGQVHAAALRNAKSGTMLALLCADHVPSIEAFAACEARFKQGKRLIICHGPRTYCETEVPPITTARKMLAWTWEHKHPHVAESVWGAGKTDQPAVLLFVQGENVVAHGFHLHPFAVLADGRNLNFGGITIDDNLPSLFQRDEIHIVQDADEMALAECSPLEPERFRIMHRVLTLQDVRAWAAQKYKNGRPFVNDMHKWFFQFPICVQGDAALADNPDRVRELIAAAG